MKSFKQFIKENGSFGEPPPEDDPLFGPALNPFWRGPDIVDPRPELPVDLPDPSSPWYFGPGSDPDSEQPDNPYYSPGFFSPDIPQWYKPIDLPEFPSPEWGNPDSDGDGIPDLQDPDPFDPTNPSWDMPYGKPFDPNNPFPDGRPYVPPFIASAPKNTGIMPK